MERPDNLEKYVINKSYIFAPILYNFMNMSKNSGNDYDSIHIYSETKNDPFFISAIPKVDHITFVIIYMKKYPGEVFFVISDHVDGVYNRICLKNKGKYVVMSSTQCMVGKNKLEEDETIFCFFPVRPKYLNIEWETGEVLGDSYL